MAGVAQVALGSQGFQVSAQGLGCMPMTGAYGDLKPEGEMVELIRTAVDHGITMLDTSKVFGPLTNEVLVGKAIKGRREKVQLCSKFGVNWDGVTASIRGDPEHVRSSCNGSLQRLDVDYIDLYYQQRVDYNVPIEITMGEMKKLVQEGKVKYVGLSNASASDIRRAHAVHPITAVQVEYSLWCRGIEKDVIPTCRELGIGIVAFSPLGRGFFAGLTFDRMLDNDFRKTQVPQFSSENFHQNRKRFYERLLEIGGEKKCGPGQLALAWVHHKGAIPIPGTTNLKHQQENMAALGITLTPEEIQALEAAVPYEQVQGDTSFRDSWMSKSSPPLDSWTGSKPV